MINVDKKKKIFIANIINFQNVDEPRGWGLTMWKRFLMIFDHLNTYLVVFSLYPAITDLRYDIISPSTLNFPPIKGLLGIYSLHNPPEIL